MNNSNEKFCTKCGRKFLAVGREVICPACREAAAEETKRAAVERAKRASWTGESVPVRISGRASTVIREYGKAHDVPFAAALDDLLKETNYFKGTGKAWNTIQPYKSRRRGKATSTTETAQDVQEAPQEVKTAQAAKKADKAAGKATAASKVASKAAGKKGGKAC